MHIDPSEFDLHEPDDFETTTGIDVAVPDADPPVQPLEIVADARSLVLARYPFARWIIDGDFGRIVAGEVLVSLAIPLLDVDAETTGWLDACQRLGTGNDWRSSRDSKRDRRGRVHTGRRELAPE